MGKRKWNKKGKKQTTTERPVRVSIYFFHTFFHLKIIFHYWQFITYGFSFLSSLSLIIDTKFIKMINYCNKVF